MKRYEVTKSHQEVKASPEAKQLGLLIVKTIDNYSTNYETAKEALDYANQLILNHIFEKDNYND